MEKDNCLPGLMKKNIDVVKIRPDVMIIASPVSVHQVTWNSIYMFVDEGISKKLSHIISVFMKVKGLLPHLPQGIPKIN